MKVSTGSHATTTDTNATTTKQKGKNDKQQTLGASFSKVDACSGGRTRDSKVKYENWEDHITTFYSVYESLIRAVKFMVFGDYPNSTALHDMT